MSQHDDDPVSNPSANKHFSEVLEVSMQRRRMLQGGLGATVLSFFGVAALTKIGEAIAQGIPPAPSFLPIPAAFTDEARVPVGYTAQVLYRWGDPTGIKGNMPDFDSDGGVSWNSAADQAVQAGMDHDGMHYFPHDWDHDDDHHRHRRQDKRRGKRNSGLLWWRDRYLNPRASRLRTGRPANGVKSPVLRHGSCCHAAGSSGISANRSVTPTSSPACDSRVVACPL